MQASELFKQSNTVLLDGGMGTMLQASGLKLGAKPEELNITNPELIESIHAKYAAAGSRIVNANTFGASAHKLAGSAYSLEEIIAAGIANCKRACAPYGALAALDVGPSRRTPHVERVLGEVVRLPSRQVDDIDSQQSEQDHRKRCRPEDLPLDFPIRHFSSPLTETGACRAR